MSFFSLMEDEHIGSFWLRQYMVKGNKIDREKLKTVMKVASDRWVLLPSLGKEYDTPEINRNHTLLNMLRPTSSPWEGSQIYTFRHFQDYSSIGVRFCPLCFIEQISQSGFVWFKRQWLIFNSAHCLSHRCSLLTFKCNSCNKIPQIHEGIESFLLGRCKMCKNPFLKLDPHIEQELPILTIWLNKVLNSNFPHFTRKLPELCSSRTNLLKSIVYAAV